MRTAGMLPRGPNWSVACIGAGAVCGWGFGPDASTVSGAFSFSAQNGRSFQWLPRSDIVPLPKSHQRYHFGPGTYTGLNGRSGAGPSHRSQSSDAGGFADSFGRSLTVTLSPYFFASSGDCRPQARETHTCTSRTSPMAPLWTSS